MAGTAARMQLSTIPLCGSRPLPACPTSPFRVRRPAADVANGSVGQVPWFSPISNRTEQLPVAMHIMAGAHTDGMLLNCPLCDAFPR